MGSAASALKDAELVTPEQLRAAVSSLSTEEHAKLSAAVAQLHALPTADAGATVVAAGENEDGADEALAAELVEQEKMVQTAAGLSLASKQLECSLMQRNRADREGPV